MGCLRGSGRTVRKGKADGPRVPGGQSEKALKPLEAPEEVRMVRASTAEGPSLTDSPTNSFQPKPK